jgi:hypothetical protein
MNNEQVNLGMIKLPLTLAAKDTKRVNFSGSFVSILTNTLSIDPIVSADGGAASAIPAGIGLPAVRLSADRSTLIPAVFKYLDFYNPADEAMTITFSIALGTPLDTRTVVSGYIQIDASAPALSTPEPLTVATDAFSILASNVLVKERLVQNTGENRVWFGDANTDPATGRGNYIDAGGSATINCWGAIYFKAEGGATRVSVVNVVKVV